MNNPQIQRPLFLRLSGPIAGVSAGLARDFNTDVVLVRILWIVLFSLGLGAIAYPACWIAFPKASDPTLGNRDRILGVCNQVAKRWGQPVGLVRLLAISLIFISCGSAIIGYFLAYLILPQQESPSSSQTTDA